LVRAFCGNTDFFQPDEKKQLMKKIYSTLLLLVMMVSLNSCLLTLFPIYTEKDIVYLPDLLGYFKKINEDKDEEWMVIQPLSEYKGKLTPGLEAIKNKGYLVSFSDKEKNNPNKFIAFSPRLGNGLYMDFAPLHKAERDPVYENMRIPMHAVYRIRDLNKNGFLLHRFSSGFLSGLIERKKIRISNEYLNGEAVITASTKELQDYIHKYGHLEDAYESKPETYRKK
jgi:hypothetical protein